MAGIFQAGTPEFEESIGSLRELMGVERKARKRALRGELAGRGLFDSSELGGGLQGIEEAGLREFRSGAAGLLREGARAGFEERMGEEAFERGFDPRLMALFKERQRHGFELEEEFGPNWWEKLLGGAVSGVESFAEGGGFQ